MRKSTRLPGLAPVSHPQALILARGVFIGGAAADRVCEERDLWPVLHPITGEVIIPLNGKKIQKEVKTITSYFFIQEAK